LRDSIEITELVTFHFVAAKEHYFMGKDRGRCKGQTITIFTCINEKALREMQGGAKKFRPTADPFPGVQGCQNLISCGDGHYIHLQTQFGEDQCTQFRVFVVIDPHTNTHKHRTDYDYDTLHRQA